MTKEEKVTQDARSMVEYILDMGFDGMPFEWGISKKLAIMQCEALITELIIAKDELGQCECEKYFSERENYLYSMIDIIKTL